MPKLKTRRAIRRFAYYLCVFSTIVFSLTMLIGIWVDWGNETAEKIVQSTGLLALASALIVAVTQAVEPKHDSE